MDRYAWYLAALVSLALVVFFAPAPAPIAAEAQPMQPVAAAPQNVREAWAVDVLARLGNTQPSADTVAFVVAWTVAEDSCMQDCGYSSAWERFNPLNTTQTGYGAYATINGDGVKAYPDYESGMAATVQTLSYSYYAELVAGLQANDPERALRGLYVSPWGTNAAHVEEIWRTR